MQKQSTHSHTHQSCSPRVWNQQAAPWPPFCGWVVCSETLLTEPQHQCHPPDLQENRKTTRYQLQRSTEKEYNVLSTTYTKTCNIKTMQYQLCTGIQCALNYITTKTYTGIQCALNYFAQNIHRNPIWPQLLYTKTYTGIQCDQNYFTQKYSQKSSVNTWNRSTMCWQLQADTQ